MKDPRDYKLDHDLEQAIQEAEEEGDMNDPYFQSPHDTE